ncbi:uncoordinated protein 73 [Aphelenchoides avenae]|nr:uncoordinated protein 73 [Aphelenchus avenae]
MVENVPDQPSFILNSTDTSQPVTFILRANTPDEKKQWLEKIASQLDQQEAFLDALVDPKRACEELSRILNPPTLKTALSAPAAG